MDLDKIVVLMQEKKTSLVSLKEVEHTGVSPGPNVTYHKHGDQYYRAAWSKTPSLAEMTLINKELALAEQKQAATDALMQMSEQDFRKHLISNYILGNK